MINRDEYMKSKGFVLTKMQNVNMWINGINNITDRFIYDIEENKFEDTINRLLNK